MKTKICYHCKIEKSVACFKSANGSKSADKLSLFCNECAPTLSEKQKGTMVSKLWRANNAIRSRATQQHNHFRKTYGIGLEDYEARLEQQNGVCAICQKPSVTRHQSGKTRLLSVDHNHSTGRVRDLLCNSCNHGLGAFKDDVILLEAAIKYLKKHE